MTDRGQSRHLGCMYTVLFRYILLLSVPVLNNARVTKTKGELSLKAKEILNLYSILT